KKLILQSKNEADNIGSKFILVSGVEHYQTERNRQQNLKEKTHIYNLELNSPGLSFENFAKSNNLNFINLFQSFSNGYSKPDPFFELDGHWNKFGHEIVAKELSVYIIENFEKNQNKTD